MKKSTVLQIKRAYLVICMTTLTALSVMGQSQQFTLSGEIKGASHAHIYFQYPCPSGKVVEDSVKIVSGKFNYSGLIDEPTLVRITTHRNIKRIDDPNIARVFFEPAAMHIKLEIGNFKNLQLSGSKTHDEQVELNRNKESILKQLEPYLEEYNRVNEEYMAALAAKKPEAELDQLKEQASAIQLKLSPFYSQIGEIEDAFIRSNPDSYLSAYLLQFRSASMSADSAEAVYGNLSPQIQQSYWGREARKTVDRLKLGTPGSLAALFTTQDIEGNILSLEDLRGKYVLLDFWASWCVPCRKGNPHLLELYSQYKDKGFEIIGISDDDSKPDAWRKAVEKDRIGVWKHVLRGLQRTETGFDRSKDISDPYGIRSLPTKILIDPHGMIIGRYGGDGENDAAMDAKLKEIFN